MPVVKNILNMLQFCINTSKWHTLLAQVNVIMQQIITDSTGNN